MNEDICDQEPSPADLKYLFDLPAKRQYSTVIQWLTGDDTRRSTLALGVICHLGDAGVSLLFSEAIAPRKAHRHRIKLLQALEKTEQPLSVGQCFDMMTVMRRFGPEVREQMARLLALRRPGGGANDRLFVGHTCPKEAMAES